MLVAGQHLFRGSAAETGMGRREPRLLFRRRIVNPDFIGDLNALVDLEDAGALLCFGRLDSEARAIRWKFHEGSIAGEYTVDAFPQPLFRR